MYHPTYAQMFEKGRRAVQRPLSGKSRYGWSRRSPWLGKAFQADCFVLYNTYSMSWSLEIAIEPRYAQERRFAMAGRWWQ